MKPPQIWYAHYQHQKWISTACPRVFADVLRTLKSIFQYNISFNLHKLWGSSCHPHLTGEDIETQGSDRADWNAIVGPLMHSAMFSIAPSLFPKQPASSPPVTTVLSLLVIELTNIVAEHMATRTKDCISQLPLQLGVAMWLSTDQLGCEWKRRGQLLGRVLQESGLSVFALSPFRWLECSHDGRSFNSPLGQWSDLGKWTSCTVKPQARRIFSPWGLFGAELPYHPWTASLWAVTW